MHGVEWRSEEHTSELQSPVPISYAVFCLKKKIKKKKQRKKRYESKLQQVQHTKDQLYTTVGSRRKIG